MTISVQASTTIAVIPSGELFSCTPPPKTKTARFAGRRGTGRQLGRTYQASLYKSGETPLSERLKAKAKPGHHGEVLHPATDLRSGCGGNYVLRERRDVVVNV